MSDDRPPADDPLGTLLFEMTVVDDSTSPLQLVSAELLAYYRQRDAKLTKLLLETAENKLADNCQLRKQVVDL
ncbi:hypothetical protein INH39_25665 [Massilia violaceinigra]|uniref:Uncharacterized protein n=1 Tax=Massilia violaceinigra TaxID=2045208 RepID=A0ABY4A3R1_9BURK|nr:hypothetical protein [Massilia violaceinigra]UOD28800.1 hypothetical protein INH39_25665 [Massilia violaceinigra]